WPKAVQVGAAKLALRAGAGGSAFRLLEENQ
ncbi:hypothetical protein RSK20926_17612, partial [Roseobacter sp. SK209-2-6]